MKLKGIDGGPHKRRNMWFNSMIRELPGLERQTNDAEMQRPYGAFVEVLHGCRQLVS